MSGDGGGTRLPFLNGAYVAVDAVDGAYLIVDGPYCAFKKAEMQFCHNLRSRLIPPGGHHRVVHTAETLNTEEVQSLSTDRTAQVEAVFAKTAALPDAEIVLATSFDFHELVNFPLKEIARRHDGGGVLVRHVPSRSLGGTWLDGYAAACAALARGATLRPGRARKGAVAIVGHLRDRDEPDDAGNRRELTRLLGALGLDVASIWLSGGGRRELEAAERAGLVVSLPYAREAARVVAERTGAGLCETGLPLGLAGTERFLLAVGAATGRVRRARRLIDGEAAAAVRDTERHALRFLAGRGAEIRQDDPHLAAGLRELCAELGLLEGAGGEGRVLFAPTFGARPRDAAHVAVGYPNYTEHPVVESPVLGYAGFRVLVDRTSAAVLRREARGGAQA